MDEKNNEDRMLPLDKVVADILIPAYQLLPAKMMSAEASVLLLTIGRQESRFRWRLQVPNGPAKGFWQFESGGAVKGVMTHSATSGYAQTVCLARQVPFVRKSVYDALQYDDILAACFARLNLWWAPGALPTLGRMEEAWDLYNDVTWRPGKPHRETWDQFYTEAWDEVAGV